MMASSPPVIAAIYYLRPSTRPAACASDFAGDEAHVEPSRQETNPMCSLAYENKKETMVLLLVDGLTKEQDW